MLQNVQEQGTLDTIELLAGHATKVGRTLNPKP
jgi:hypothetical protein